jgi:hypothetical protein
MDHLENRYIDSIASGLDGDFYGASGEMDEFQIRRAVMEAIVDRCNCHISGHSGLWGETFVPMSVEEHANKPALTLFQAACFIISAWKHKDRQLMETIVEAATGDTETA